MRYVRLGETVMAEHHPQVLVIDDDRDIADIVDAVLTDAGFAVSVLAPTGRG
jgi:DNA-binding NtrC family response regulator